MKVKNRMSQNSTPPAYVLLLRKNLSLPLRFETPHSNCGLENEYFIWGHYSSMKLEPLEDFTLETLWRQTAIEVSHASKSDCFTQPLVIYPVNEKSPVLSDCEKGALNGNLKDFISKRTFFVVTLLSFNQDLVYEHSPTLTEKTNDLGEISYSFEEENDFDRLSLKWLNGALGEEDFVYCYTLGCSDRVLIFSTDNLTVTMQHIVRLQAQTGNLFNTIKNGKTQNKRCVSYTYSITGFDIDKLKNLNNEIVLDKQLSDEVILTGIIDDCNQFKCWERSILSTLGRATKHSNGRHIQPGSHDFVFSRYSVTIRQFRDYLFPTDCKTIFKKNIETEKEVAYSVEELAFSRLSIRLRFYGDNTSIFGKEHYEYDKTLSDDSFSENLKKHVSNWKSILLDAQVEAWLDQNIDIKRILFSLMGVLKQTAVSDSTYTLFLSFVGAVDLFFYTFQTCIARINNPSTPEDNRHDTEVNVRKSIWEFIKKIDDVLSCATHAHRHQFETPDVHVKYFDVYSKLFSVYVCFCNYMSDIISDIDKDLFTIDPVKHKAHLNGNSPHYEFLLSPECAEYIEITTLPMAPKSIDASKLQIIKAPEYTMFIPHYIIPQLLHEVAHYCGSNIRNRKNRVTYFISIMTEICTQNIFDESKINSEILARTLIEEDKDNIIKIIASSQNKFRQDLKYSSLELFITSIRNEVKYNDPKEESKIAATDLVSSMVSTFQSSLTEMLTKYFQLFIGVDTDNDIKYDSIIRIEGFFQRQVNSTLFDLPIFAKFIYDVFSETFADLLMVRILDLSSIIYLQGYRDSLPNAISSFYNLTHSSRICENIEIQDPTYARLFCMTNILYKGLRPSEIGKTFPALQFLFERIEKDNLDDRKSSIYIHFIRYLQDCDALISIYLPKLSAAGVQQSFNQNDIARKIIRLRKIYKCISLFSNNPDYASNPFSEPSPEALSYLIRETTSILRDR